MLKMVDGSGVIGVDMICPLGISTPQPPNYDRVELEGAGMLVLPNSLDAPLERLELGGKTEQVQTTGAQLLPFPYVTGDMTKNGVTFAVQEDGGIKITGTATEVIFFFIAKTDFGANSIFNNGTGNGKVLSGGKDNVKIEYHGANKNTYLVVDKGMSVNTVIYPQIQNGSSATPYEPYTGGKPSPSPEYPQEIKNSGKWNEGTQKYEIVMQVKGADTELQSITLTSDRPLTKWDRLVEQGGQIGWLYQSSKMILDGTKIKWLHSNKPENIYFATTINDAFGGKGASFCKTYRNIQDSAYDIKYANERCIYSDHPTYTSGDKFFRAPNENVTTLEQWKEWVNGNPIEMLYHTKNSEFIPLPQSEQNAIRALKTYYPTTVITVDGGELDPDIKVTYRKEI